MTHSWRLSISLLAIALASPLTAADAKPGEKTLTLRPGALPVDGQALTPTCIANGQILTVQGFVLPRQGELKLGKGAATLSLPGLDLVFSGESDGRFFITPPKGQRTQLKQTEIGLQTMPVPLPSKKQAVLAFPYVYASRVGSGLFYRSGMAMKGSLEGDDLFLYDENLDVAYTARDPFSVGSGVVFAAQSEYLATRKGVFKLDTLAEDGAKLNAVKLRPPLPLGAPWLPATGCCFSASGK